jgi:uncharacterized membrane protein (UPF0127 family)
MVLVALSLAAASASASGCHQAQPRSGGPEVILSTRAGEQHVAVEIARTGSERQRGLMYRESLAAGRGMVFLFDQAEPGMKFWMKNTYIPLDMIFISTDKKVVYVEENAEPLTLQERGPDKSVLSQFVLEVPGGWARAHAVERGVSVRFVGIE